MDFETVKMPTLACDLPTPDFALIPATPRDSNVIANTDREGIHRVDVIRILGLRSFSEMIKERLKLRFEPMKSAIVS